MLLIKNIHSNGTILLVFKTFLSNSIKFIMHPTMKKGAQWSTQQLYTEHTKDKTTHIILVISSVSDFWNKFNYTTFQFESPQDIFNTLSPKLYSLLQPSLADSISFVVFEPWRNFKDQQNNLLVALNCFVLSDWASETDWASEIISSSNSEW